MAGRKNARCLSVQRLGCRAAYGAARPRAGLRRCSARASRDTGRGDREPGFDQGNAGKIADSDTPATVAVGGVSQTAITPGNPGKPDTTRTMIPSFGKTTLISRLLPNVARGSARQCWPSVHCGFEGRQCDIAALEGKQCHIASLPDGPPALVRRHWSTISHISTTETRQPHREPAHWATASIRARFSQTPDHAAPHHPTQYPTKRDVALWQQWHIAVLRIHQLPSASPRAIGQQPHIRACGSQFADLDEAGADDVMSRPRRPPSGVARQANRPPDRPQRGRLGRAL